jgi:general secretion pathway protein G
MCRTLHLRNRAAALDARGLTLIEVLCVLTIAIILLIVVMPRYGHGHGNARLTATVTQIAVFKTQLGVFRDDNGFYPVGTNGLQDLVRQPAGTTNWHGPYAQDIPKDPWGREYVYEIPGKHTSSGYPYDLFSLGLTPGTNVIANWAFPSLKP